MPVRLLMLALVALVLAGCSGSDQRSSVASAPGKVTELKSVDGLKAAFAEGDGKPRLLLLLSPT